MIFITVISSIHGVDGESFWWFSLFLVRYKIFIRLLFTLSSLYFISFVCIRFFFFFNGQDWNRSFEIVFFQKSLVLRFRGFYCAIYIRKRYIVIITKKNYNLLESRYFFHPIKNITNKYTRACHLSFRLH